MFSKGFNIFLLLMGLLFGALPGAWPAALSAEPLTPQAKVPNSVPQKTNREETESAPDYSPVSIEPSIRTHRKLGVMVGLLADPLPTWFGVHLAFNTWDFGRVRASYGTTLGNVQAWGGGVDFLAPGWNVSPTLGIAYTAFSVGSSATGSVMGVDPGQFAARWCASIGIDYQAESGAQIGVGYQLALTGTGGNPYFRAGWFFDWF